MSESYAEIETHIGQSLHKLHYCEINIVAVACNFQVSHDKNCALDKTDVKRHHTSQNQLISLENNTDPKICPLTSQTKVKN